jgi:flagellar biosynthesis/type III secretory pathway ATPase
VQALPVFSPKKAADQHSNFDNAINSLALPILRKAFSDVSQIVAEQILLETSIFALGIDSTAAIRVASECREQGVQLSVADILQGRWIGGIIQILNQKTSVSTGNIKNEEVPLVIRDNVISRLKYPASSIEQILPCLAGQVYHLASWLNCGRTFYEPTWALRSREKIDSVALRKA